MCMATRLETYLLVGRTLSKTRRAEEGTAHPHAHWAHIRLPTLHACMNRMCSEQSVRCMARVAWLSSTEWCLLPTVYGLMPGP